MVNAEVKSNCQQKKKYQKKKHDQKNSSLTTRNNAIEGSGKNKKDNKKCYNYLKKGYFAKNYFKTPKTKIFMLMTNGNKEIIIKILYIYYLVQF